MNSRILCATNVGLVTFFPLCLFQRCVPLYRRLSLQMQPDRLHLPIDRVAYQLEALLLMYFYRPKRYLQDWYWGGHLRRVDGFEGIHRMMYHEEHALLIP
jgi:hypothetical protein